MRQQTIVRTDQITCPECGHFQEAPATWTEGDPFVSFVHWCVNCNYCIMESEWEVQENQPCAKCAELTKLHADALAEVARLREKIEGLIRVNHQLCDATDEEIQASIDAGDNHICGCVYCNIAKDLTLVLMPA